MKTFLILSSLFALAAAALSGVSAFVYVPALKSDGDFLVITREDGAWVDFEAPHYAALAKIEHLNACAAAFAFLSGLAQVMALFTKLS